MQAGGEEIHTKAMAQGGRNFGREMWWSTGGPDGNGVMAAEHVHRRRTPILSLHGFKVHPFRSILSLEGMNLLGLIHAPAKLNLTLG